MDGATLEEVANALVIAHMVISAHDTASAKNEYPKLNHLATTKFPRTYYAPAASVLVMIGSRWQHCRSPCMRCADVD